MKYRLHVSVGVMVLRAKYIRPRLHENASIVNACYSLETLSREVVALRCLYGKVLGKLCMWRARDVTRDVT